MRADILRSAYRSQRGLTLVELMIAIALFGILAGSITMAFSHVFIHSARASSQMSAVRQVQSAGYWVSQDVLQARVVNPTEGSGFPLTLEIPYRVGEGHESVENRRQVDYDVVNGRLLRTIIYPDEPDSPSVETLVAEHITAVDFTEDNDHPGVYIFTVSALAPLRHVEGSGSIVTREYRIDPRPGG